MPNNTLAPITRNNMFYSEDDFMLETDILVGYMEEDTNQTVVVYEVDRSKTNTDSTYKETGKSGVRFKAPKEIPCLYEIQESQLKSYDTKTNNAVYAINGNLKIYVMPLVLEKYNCDIKRGDYIGVLIDTKRMAYFSVVNDGKVNTANTHVVGAYKTAFRTVECAPVTDEEFSGK